MIVYDDIGSDGRYSTVVSLDSLHVFTCPLTVVVFIIVSTKKNLNDKNVSECILLKDHRALILFSCSAVSFATHAKKGVRKHLYISLNTTTRDRASY